MTTPMTATGLDPTHDYCTLFPDVVFGVDLRLCCFQHDLAYAAQMPKVQADLDLSLCVAKLGHPLLGLLMLAGVLVFGAFFYWRARRK